MQNNNLKKLVLKNNSDASFYRFDPKIGFWGIPNIQRNVSFEQNRDELIPVCHNEEGNRDAPFKVNVDKATVFCIGGSHTWGVGIQQEYRYSNLLEEKLGERVVNLGHCSLGLDQICLILLQKAEQYSPSVIVIEQYPWALHRILNNYVVGYIRPHFSLNMQGDLQLRKVPKLARIKIFRKLLGDSYLYRKELREFMAGIDLNGSYDSSADPIFLLWKTSHYNYMYQMVDKILKIIKDFCLKKKIHLLFSIGAITQQFGPKSKSSLIDYDLPKKKLIVLLEKHGIPYIDLTDSLLNQHSLEDPVIFSDGHINKKGNKISADAIFNQIKKNGWL